jgi:hypothetical protein
MIENRLRTEQNELKAAYVHEVAHAVVALHFGCEVVVEVSYSRASRYFKGACNVRHPDGELPPVVLRVIGLAGTVGEIAYWQGWEPSRLTVASLVDELRAGSIEISATDQRMANGWQVEDMELAFEIVRNAWGWIVEEAKARARRDHPWLAPWGNLLTMR